MRSRKHETASSGNDSYSAPRLFWITFSLTIFWALSGLIIPAIGLLIRQSNSKILSSIEISDILVGRLSLQLFAYVFGFVVVYGILSWLISSVARVLGDHLQLKGRSTLLLALGVWAISISWIQLLNARLYPRSKVKYFDQEFALSNGGEWLLYLQGIVILLIAAGAATVYLRRYNPKHLGLLAPLGIFLVGLGSFAAPKNELSGQGTAKPNVILIGIDSLRTDRVSPADRGTGSTPNIDQFLSNSSLFTQAYTPLARTYPSWMSVLTGQYPRTNGVRYNLTPMSSVARESSVAWLFREQGYDTILAMDERRFANIDAKHGFDVEIGPKMGAGDFLLASVTDSPLTNLLLDTAIGKHLFSFNHLNRAVDHLYYPERFDQALSATITSRSPARPLFLVAHFCLPHWPYQWAELSTHSNAPDISRAADYDKAIAVTDAQVGRLMSALEQAGALENAIVVLLSDHGESLGEALQGQGDSTIARLLKREEWGHGTNVFRDEQYRVLFGIKGYGDYRWINGNRVETPVSLVDVAPTILDLLGKEGYEQASNMDGISLRPILEGSAGTLTQRPIFLESGFSIPAILAVNPSVQDVFRQGFQHYRVNRTDGRLVVKKSSHEHILNSKQRAVVYGDWQLGSIIDEQSGQILYGLRRLHDDAWSDDMDGELAGSAPVSRLMNLLSGHFGEELLVGEYGAEIAQHTHPATE